MNWAVVLFFAIMTFAALAYLVRARKVYKGPVATVVDFPADEIEEEKSSQD